MSVLAPDFWPWFWTLTSAGAAVTVALSLDDLFQGIICGHDARVPKIRL